MPAFFLFMSQAIDKYNNRARLTGGGLALLKKTIQTKNGAKMRREMNTLFIILGIIVVILGLAFYFSLCQVAGRADDQSEAQYKKLQEQKGGGQSENDSAQTYTEKLIPLG